MAHSPIGASSYYRWKACPGSVRECKGIVSRSSEYAEEGTKAHEYAAEWLKQGHVSPNLEVANPEMFDAVKVYADFVLSLLNENTQIWIEESFDLSEYYPGLYGTCDAIVHDPRLQKLFVIDYKHGAGIPVDPVENLQLMYYGVGALHSRQIPVRSVELIIVQPRCNGEAIKRWQTDPMRLTEFIDDLKKDAAATADPKAPLSPGSHCRFCAAQPTCPAIQEKSMALAKTVFSPVGDYEPKKLSEVLNYLPAIESWCKSVREFAYIEAEAGRTPPGYKLVPKRAVRKWKEMVTGELLASEFGLKPPSLFETTLVSPATVEKMIKEEMKRMPDRKTINPGPTLLDHFEKFVDKESSGKTLVATGDDRAAIDTKPKFDAITD